MVRRERQRSSLVEWNGLAEGLTITYRITGYPVIRQIPAANS